MGAALLSMIMLPFLTRYSATIWDKSVEKCPRPVYNACCNINLARDRLYNRVDTSTRKSRKALYRSMTHTYINILAIALIEAAFYFIIPATVDWGCSSFGGTETVWEIGMLVVNFIILALPIYHLVNNVKFLDEMVINGARRIAQREGSSEEPRAIYQRFLEINTSLMVLAIDAAIIIIVPNSVGIWLHIVVLALALVVLLLVFYKKYRDGKKPSKQQDDEDDGEREEESE